MLPLLINNYLRDEDKVFHPDLQGLLNKKTPWVTTPRGTLKNTH